MLYSIGIAAVVMLMWRRRWPVGTYIATTCLLYAPVRFSMDFLRTADVTYFGLTPGQYASISAFPLWHLHAGARARPGIRKRPRGRARLLLSRQAAEPERAYLQRSLKPCSSAITTWEGMRLVALE